MAWTDEEPVSELNLLAASFSSHLSDVHVNLYRVGNVCRLSFPPQRTLGHRGLPEAMRVNRLGLSLGFEQRQVGLAETNIYIGRTSYASPDSKLLLSRVSLHNDIERLNCNVDLLRQAIRYRNYLGAFSKI